MLHWPSETSNGLAPAGVARPAFHVDPTIRVAASELCAGLCSLHTPHTPVAPSRHIKHLLSTLTLTELPPPVPRTGLYTVGSQLNAIRLQTQTENARLERVKMEQATYPGPRTVDYKKGVGVEIVKT